MKNKTEMKKANKDVKMSNKANLEDSASQEKNTTLEIVDDNSDLADSYKVKLKDFEGPLDLLLHLIKEAKIDIKDIFISEITEQFIEYVNSSENLPLEKMSEFILMSATLIEIKSKKLLPVKKEEVAEEDEEQKLIRRLEEYSLFKEASQKLGAIEDYDKFYKAPDNSVGSYRYTLPENLSYDNLLDAFANIMHKISAKAETIKPKEIKKDRFTVAQKTTEIKDLLKDADKIKFSEICSTDYSKSEVINTFLAMLELLKMQVIKVVQDKTFDDISISKSVNYGKNDIISV